MKLTETDIWAWLERIQDTMRGDRSQYQDWPQRVACLFTRNLAVMKHQAQNTRPTWIHFLSLLIEPLEEDVSVDAPLDMLCEFSHELKRTDSAMEIAEKLHNLAIQTPPRAASPSKDSPRPG